MPYNHQFYHPQLVFPKKIIDCFNNFILTPEVLINGRQVLAKTMAVCGVSDVKYLIDRVKTTALHKITATTAISVENKKPPFYLVRFIDWSD